MTGGSGGAARVQLIGIAATVSAVLPAFTAGAVGVQLRDDLGIGGTALGAAIAVFFATATLASSRLGRLCERLGPVRSLRRGAALAAFVSIAIAVFAADLPTLSLLLAVGGLANALTQPAANLLLARALPPARLGFAMGLKQSGMPAATMIGGLTVPTLATTISWQAAYYPGAALALITLGLLAGLPTTQTLNLYNNSRVSPASRLSTPRRMLTRLSVGMTFGAAAAGALAAFIVSSAEDTGVAPGRAGLLLAGGSACGIAVRLLVGYDADRRAARDLPIVALLLLGGAAAFALLAIHRSPVTIAATPLAFGAGWSWPGRFNLAVMRANPDAPARATGFTQTGTYLGALIGPFGFGLAVDAFGYPTAWSLAAASALTAAAIFTAADRVLGHQR